MPNSLIENEINIFDFVLEELISRMKHYVLEVLLPFISFMHDFDKKKSHNMLALMLDPKYKNMDLVIIYLVMKTTAILVVVYAEQLILLLLLEVYKGLMPNMDDCPIDSFMDSQYLL